VFDSGSKRPHSIRFAKFGTVRWQILALGALDRAKFLLRIRGRLASFSAQRHVERLNGNKKPCRILAITAKLDSISKGTILCKHTAEFITTLSKLLAIHLWSD
jgi:hypothetical protein